MKRLSIMLSVLVLILHTVSSGARNLILINTTNAIVNVTATFRELTSGYCETTRMDRDIGPRDMFIQNIAHCSLDTITLYTRGQPLISRRFSPNAVTKGMFAIRARSVDNRLEYFIDGPHTEREITVGTLYLVNITGYPMKYYAEYHGLFCRTDKGTLQDGELVQLRIGTCASKYIYGYDIVVGGGHANARTVNTYTGRGINGVFVFRRRQGTNEFEVAGPFRE